MPIVQRLLAVLAKRATVRCPGLIVAGCMLGLCLVASAQETPPAETPGEAAEQAPPPAPPAPQPPKGDVIKLRSGAEITGVQVLRQTPAEYFVEVVPGIEPLRVPRRQVASVEYDNIEPSRVRRRGRTEGGHEDDMIPGHRLQPELGRKLSADISEPPIQFEDEDLVQVLKRLGERAGVTIEIGEPVLQIPPEQRRCSVNVPADATLMTVLQQAVLTQFEMLEVVYQYDKVLITTKEAAQHFEKSPAAPPQEPSPPAR